jgi:hypothetical protein
VPVPARGSQNERYLIEMLTKCTDARGVSHWRPDDVSIRDSRGRPDPVAAAIGRWLEDFAGYDRPEDPEYY